MGDELKKIKDDQDANAFRSLFLTYGPKVRAMLMRQGADGDTADDIVQDTMLTVWSKSHLFSASKGAVSAWIYTIARNLRTDRLRRQVVWDRLRNQLTELNGAQSAVADTSRREEDRLEINGALGDLPADQFEVIKLSFIDGLTQTEIAERLGLPLGTVKSRMRLAFEKLRYAIGEKI